VSLGAAMIGVGADRLDAHCCLCGSEAVTWQWEIDEFDTPSPWDDQHMVEFGVCVWLCQRCHDDLVAKRPDWAAQRVLVQWQKADGGVRLGIDDEASLIARIQVVAGTVRDRWTGQEAAVTIDNEVPIVGDFQDVLHPQPLNLVDEAEDSGWRMDKPDPPSVGQA